MLRLIEKRLENLKSQFATSSWGGRRALPLVFSEHGVLMLSSVLNSKQAIEVNIQVMRVFTKIRQMLADNTEIRLEVERIKSNWRIRIKIWKSYLNIWMNYWKKEINPIHLENGLGSNRMICNSDLLIFYLSQICFHSDNHQGYINIRFLMPLTVSPFQLIA